jgi:multimeric flavodoxin WrbA
MFAEAGSCEALGMDERVTRILVVYQSRSGGTRRLVDAVTAGVRMALDSGAGTLSVIHAFEASADDVKAASGIVIATPANFGYMSGAVKDFFERIYHPCLDETAGKPYVIIVKGDTDVEGAASSIRRITTGMNWREVLPALLVVGELIAEHEESAHELGATLAAGIEAGIY